MRELSHPGSRRPATPSARPMTTPPVASTPRVRAPEFPDRLDWINTGGRALTLAGLRGKIVLLDFWTYG